ncbi:succinyldiaminopimelate transaminase [Halorhodospira halophila]|uniref:Aminotransferase n=1 Tax=Halorhodospira halophila (strain DSM 244 / SL1) TaxID=349124 RepID=A1WX24_HALHL|nr:succinyldiaminopimelate transaminase [Halorhodospira halophila]ABM62236.1 aminotransferase [Halorhodospira halophila SL1]MBK1729211.1 succinyldiaminopimelate transaminase [Halorhodospira halophila]
MNRGLSELQPYPFERMERLLTGRRAGPAAPIRLGIGEPQDPPPELLTRVLRDNLDQVARYPATRGLESLREAIAGWLRRRYRLPEAAINPDEHVLPVAGTREALFAIAQTVIGRGRPYVAMPNPFYQIYEGAALLSGARPLYLPIEPGSGLPDLDAIEPRTWQRVQLLYLNSPANPTGAVADSDYYRRVLELCDRYGFIIAADECYSEIYADEANPPPGLLQVCQAEGRADFHRCLVFHSLSKRSNAPGLRSGFVAGDPGLIHAFLRYRTYQGCALPLHVQAASAAAWRDEAHVIENRARYRERYEEVCTILAEALDEVAPPPATFYLWPRTPIDDQTFTRRLWEEENVTVLPGSFLSRPGGDGTPPGAGRIRMALVPDLATCIEAAERIRRFVHRNFQ